MRANFWLFLAALVSTNLLAQQATNTPVPAATDAATNVPAAASTSAPTSAPSTNAPASKSTAKKNSSKKKSSDQAKATRKKDPAAELQTLPLVAGPATVVASNVNVRGQAKLKSEVVAHLTKGQTVSVLEEVTLKNSGPDEPSAWAKIILPPKTPVWVNASFLDTNQTVVPKKLKIRGGPGENYSVLGMLKKGDELKVIGAKDDWTKIEAPAEACAFVAAQYLRQEPGGAQIAAATEAPATTTTTTPPPPTTTLTDPGTVAAATPETTTLPPGQPAITNAPDPSASITNDIPKTDTPPTETTNAEPPPKRIVQREGLVRGTFSIQAPTHFELVSPDNGRAINYLYASSPTLDLQRYKGMRIIVTGEEALDERWRNTPVITIQKITVVE